jgi:diadenosine tetraphosphate (Ap4A) HIT family hydrolase
MNETILRFGYPDTLVKEYDHWVVLLRPPQVTLGSLILACKEDAQRLSDVSVEAYTELKAATVGIETALSLAFQYDKINYLALMMVDKEVHFHVIPRYGRAIDMFGHTFLDAGWPAVPQLGATADISDAQFNDILEKVRGCMPRAIG